MRAISLLLLAALLAGCSGWVALKQHRQFVETLDQRDDLVHRQLVSDNFSLRYTIAGSGSENKDEKKALLLWLHGTPGAWSEAGGLLTHQALLEKMLLVTIDRPGWGDSQLLSSPEGNSTRYPFASFEKQSQLISPLLEKLATDYPDLPLYIGGHSWGASLAPKIALDNPGKVSGLLLVAGALSPELAEPRWYNRMAGLWPVNTLTGDALRLSNAEMYELPSGLADLEPHWQALGGMAILVLQGGRDSLVYPAHADYASKVLPAGTQVIVDSDYGHLWHIDRSDTLATCLIALVEEQLGRCRRALPGNGISSD